VGFIAWEMGLPRGSGAPVHVIQSTIIGRELEVSRQLEAFQDLLGKDPAHINSHQHVHMHEPVRSITLQVCQRLGISLRNLSPELHYFTRFYGQTVKGLPLPTHISLEWLVEILSTLLPTGWTVLTCHPGYVDQEG
jgi:predicted glycoside hydrolase/deacetylase ChbG (UPF0249 family)